MSEAYRLGKSHQTVERSAVVREFHTFNVGDSKGVGFQSKSGKVDVVLDDIALDLTSSVCDLECLSGVDKAAAGLVSEELMVPLLKYEISSINEARLRTHATSSNL